MAPYPLALLKAAGEGDRDAICGLVAAVQGDVQRFARRTCRSSSDVDGIATILALSREAAKARLDRARTLLREYLRA